MRLGHVIGFFLGLVGVAMMVGASWPVTSFMWALVDQKHAVVGVLGLLVAWTGAAVFWMIGD